MGEKSCEVLNDGISGKQLAHNVKDKWRSDDICQNSDVESFQALFLSKRTLLGLEKSGFEKPSPVQSKAIPIARCGVDMIIQAKSGTGKTCVFAVISLEMVSVKKNHVQAIVLAPTREIAVQVADAINTIGLDYAGLRCFAFIGGRAVEQDKAKLRKCHIFVGTPGRTKQLIETGLLKTSCVRLFILDEADKLLDTSFANDINFIYSSLPCSKQILALSATYPDEVINLLKSYMKNPSFVRLNPEDVCLLGLQQFFLRVPIIGEGRTAAVLLKAKYKILTKVLLNIAYSQCLIFLNSQQRSQTLYERLQQDQWPVELLAGHQGQERRLKSLDQLKSYKCRILVTTDLSARGIDSENVSLVINFDVPYGVETYLHRIGRSGRYGTFGVALSLPAGEEELRQLKEIIEAAKAKVQEVESVDELRRILDPKSVEEDGEESAASTPMTPATPLGSRPGSALPPRHRRSYTAVRQLCVRSCPTTPFRNRDSSASSSHNGSTLSLLEKVQSAMLRVPASSSLATSIEEVAQRVEELRVGTPLSRHESLRDSGRRSRSPGTMIWRSTLDPAECSALDNVLSNVLNEEHLYEENAVPEIKEESSSDEDTEEATLTSSVPFSTAARPPPVTAWKQTWRRGSAVSNQFASPSNLHRGCAASCENLSLTQSLSSADFNIPDPQWMTLGRNLRRNGSLLLHQDRAAEQGGVVSDKLFEAYGYYMKQMLFRRTSMCE